MIIDTWPTYLLPEQNGQLKEVLRKLECSHLGLPQPAPAQLVLA